MQPAVDTAPMSGLTTEAVTGLSPLVPRTRLLVLACSVLVSAGLVAAFGIPERPWVLAWIVGALLLLCLGNPARFARQVLDWLPILVITAGYDLVRSQAPDLIARAVVRPQLRFDEIVFGGTAPTVTLQDAAFTPESLKPWDYLMFCTYLTHFLVSPIAAAVLYVRDRPAFRRFASLILSVSLFGFATYFVLPAVPPWMASREGALAPTVRIVRAVWEQLGLTGVAEVFAGDIRVANPVAALPSLHAAWPFLLLLFCWRRAPRGRFVLLGYNLSMALALVYGAEHYVSDILLGWLYAAVVYVAWVAFWKRRDTARTARTRLATPD